MERMFLEMRERHRGPVRRAFFWLRLTWDTGSQAVGERLTTRRRGSTNGREDEGMGSLMNDARHAVRSVVRRPGHGLMIIFMMTLAIAGNAAVFRVFNGLFLRPLPFEEAERLVDLDVRAPRWNLDFVAVAYQDFDAWRADNETFEAMGVFSGTGATLSGDDEAVRVDVIAASHDLATTLGLEARLGRFFSAEEDIPDGRRVAMISSGLWERRWGSDPDALGTTIVLDGEPYEVMGVLPPAASFLAESDVWIPLQENPAEEGSFYLSAVGRLAPGVTAERAEEDLTRIHKGRVEARPVNRGTFPVVHSLRDRYLGEYRLGGLVLLGAVAIVLLIACANIAALMLARALDRAREVGIRLAMGARRLRIVRQLLMESLLLAAVGAAVGSLLGVQGSSLVVDRLAEQFPGWVVFDLDARFVLFTVALTVAAAVLFGLAPALQAARTEPMEALHGSSTRSTGGTGRRRAMGALVAGQVALALVLLVAAGLGVQDLRSLQSVEPGFRTENVLSYQIVLPSPAYERGPETTSFYRDHLERVRALPGVTGATGTTLLPLTSHSGWFFEVEGAPPRGDDEPNPVVLNRGVTPGYLEAMEIRLLAGRGFDEFDGRDEGDRVAVVNEAFVEEFLPHLDDPLRARIRHSGSDEDDPWFQVVGVTRNVKHYGLDEEMRPGVYQPLAQFPTSRLQAAVTTPANPTALTDDVRRILREADPDLAVFNVATMAERLDDSLWTRRASSWFVAVFSIVALLLAVGGLYGVISYAVGQRSHEIGIRMALGAPRNRVLAGILGQGMAVVGAGTAVGLAAAILVTPVVRETLVMKGGNPLPVYVGVSLLLLTVGAVANFLPARRAARTEPMRTLGTE